MMLIHTDRFAEHQTPPGHPERPERAEVMDAVAARWRERGLEIVAPREATREQLARVHGTEYLRRISETAGKSSQLDPDTYTSPESHEVALLAAGAAVDAVERVMGDSHKAAVALVRPPGHHAERNRAMTERSLRACLSQHAASMWKSLVVLGLLVGVAGAGPKVTVRSSTGSHTSGSAWDATWCGATRPTQGSASSHGTIGKSSALP